MTRGEPQSAGMTRVSSAGAMVSSAACPSLVELSLVLVGPFLGHVVRRVCRMGAKYVEKACWCQRLLLGDPGHGLVRHVRHEVVTFFGVSFRLVRRGALVQGGIPLVRLAADEAVEVLEAAAAGGPGVGGADGLVSTPGFVAFAELRRGIAIELQGSRQRRHGIGQHGAVARRAGGDLATPPMPRNGGCARLAAPDASGSKGGCVEAVVFQAACRQLFRVRCLAGAAERA